MPRKTRAAQKATTAVQQTPSSQHESETTAAPTPSSSEGAITTLEHPAAADGIADAHSPASSVTSRAKDKAVAIPHAREIQNADDSTAFASGQEEEAEAVVPAADAEAAETSEDQTASTPSKAKLTMEERRVKLNALKKKMTQSSTQNRRDLALDKQARTDNVRDATNSRKLAKAEHTLDRLDAEQRGEDWERMRNWKYTIEDGERWEEMQARGEETRDKGAIDANGLAARSYARGLRSFKPDLKTYRQVGEGSSSGPLASASTSLIRRSGGDGSSGAGQQVVRKEDIHAGINSLSYGDHKPGDPAIDRVVSHLNMEIDVRRKRSRKRPVDEGGEVTYINEKNQKFNQKIGKYFDEYTQEIRDNFERGTAL